MIQDDLLALSVGGSKRHVTPRQWLDYAAQSRLTAKAAVRVLSEVRDTLEPALRLVARSRLPPEMQERYSALLRERSTALGRAAVKGA